MQKSFSWKNKEENTACAPSALKETTVASVAHGNSSSLASWEFKKEEDRRVDL
jgi:hypothetical protein